MEWFVAAAVSALAFGFNSIISKYLLEDTSDLIFTFIYSLSALIVYTPVFAFFVLQSNFNAPWYYVGAMMVSGIGNTLAYLAFDEGIKEAEVSEIVPISRIQPVIVAALGFIFLSETLSLTNIAGIIAVTAGGYLALETRDGKLLDPLRKLVSSRAHQYGLLSAFLWASIAIIDRFTTQVIAPEIYTFFIYLTMVSTLMIYLIKDNDRNLVDVEKAVSDRKLPYVLAGVTAVIGSLGIFTAFSKAPASQVIPVLQLQVLVSVAGGLILFDERKSVYKLVGSLILLAGVYFVVQ